MPVMPRAIRPSTHSHLSRVAGVLVCSAVLLCGSLLAMAEAVDSQPLFHIERSVNANIVRYDARLLDDGSLDTKDPVDAYWLRLAEDGRRKELGWVERQMAYGFDARTTPSGMVILKMTAGIGRRIRIADVDGSYRAHTRIGGCAAIIDRIYVQCKDKSATPSVEYIELFGRNADTGEELYEKFVP